MKTKIMSVLLVLFTLLNSIPFAMASAAESDYAGSNFSTNATIASRIDSICSQYIPGEQYFVSDGGDNLNGNKNYPCTASGNGCGYFSLSWQCLAYVRWCQNELFGFDEYSSNFVELSGSDGSTETKCKTWFQNNKSKLHPGTHIRVSAGHSILYLSHDSNGVSFLHCNWGRTCIVKFETLTWSTFTSRFGYIQYANYYEDYYTAYPDNGTTEPGGKTIGIYITNTPNSTLNFRSEPSTSSSVLSSIYDNTELEITKIQNNWGYTVYNGIEGWISLDFAEFVKEFSYDVEYDSDNVSSSTVSPNGTIAVKDNPDEKDGYSFDGWNVKRNSDGKWYTEDGWFTETELGKNGYSKALFTNGDKIVVNESWINDFTNESFTFYAQWSEIKLGTYKVVTPNSTLNLRAEPSVSSTYLASIPDNTKLEITKIQDGWGYTSYNNINGWVSLNFVEFVSSQTPIIQSLSIGNSPNKTRYYIGEKFSNQGMTVFAEYSDGTQKAITDYTYSTAYFQTAGKTDITISYEGLSTSVTVTVLANPAITVAGTNGIYGSIVSIPVNVTANSYISNGNFIINFDSSVLEFSGYTAGKLLKNAALTVDGAYADGKIEVSFNSDTSITAEDTLIILNFKIKKAITSTEVSMGYMNFSTKENYTVPSSFTNAKINIFSQVTSYDKLFKDISYTYDDENVVFTVTTPAVALNRVKVTLAGDEGGYIKYTDSYTVNSDGDCVWILKIARTEEETKYAFDARSSETNKYLREYSYHTVLINKPSAIKSVSATLSEGETIFTVVTQSGNYNRLRVGLNENLVDNLGVVSSYTTNSNGEYVWMIDIPTQPDGTILYFDLRDADTNKYTKNCYKYEVNSTQNIVNSVTAEKKDDKVIFTVVTKSGNYNRLRVGPNKNLVDNLAVSNSYTVNSSGEYVWEISIDMPSEDAVLYFDLRDAATNKFIGACYKYNLDVSALNTIPIKSVVAKKDGGKTTFTVTTASGNYNRLRVGTQEKLTNNLAVSSSYTVNSSGDYVWTISIDTPSKDTMLYFDLRDASTNKYICQHYIYNLDV